MPLKYESDVWYEGSGGVINLGSTATVTLGTQLAGEDITNDVLKAEQRFSYGTVTSATTVAVKASTGFLHTINIGMPSCPSIIVYDNSTPNGTIIHRFAAGAPVGTYTFDVTFSNGLTVDAIAGGGGAAPFLSLSFR